MFNPYQQNYYPVGNYQSIVWVKGEAEASSYPVAPNNAVALWDSDAPVIYLKQADAAGRPTVKAFDLVERVQAKEPDRYDAIMKSIAGMQNDIDALKKDVYGKENENE